MSNKRNFIKMTIAVLLLQILLPISTIIFNSNITLNSYAASTETEYYINTEQELWTFATKVNSGDSFEGVTVYLTKDIKLTSNASKPWIPIGNCDVENGNLAENTTNKKVFAGIFDGNGYTISGVYIDSNSNYVGLFGYNEGTIKNLKLKESTIKSNKSYIGGIAAYNTGTIKNCHNYANIISNSSKGAFGGITGYSVNANILECSNKGKLEGTNGYIAGITGYANATEIRDSYNKGEIKASAFAAAGICGLSENSWIYNCYNNGAVTAVNYIGGIIAHSLQYSSILNSYNIGKIVSTNTNTTNEVCVAGIVAYSGLENQNNCKIVNCYNIGETVLNKTTNTSYKGNISGKHDLGIIDNCYYEKGTSTAIGKNNNKQQTANTIELEKDKLKTKEIITNLNKGQQVYFYDDQLANNGYPILDNLHRVLLQPVDNNTNTEPVAVDTKVVVKDGVRYLTGIIPPKSIAEALMQCTETEAYIILNDQKIETIDINDKMVTGIKIKTYLNDEEFDYVVSVTGDLQGDGKMGIDDLLKLARYMVGFKVDLKGEFLLATDVAMDDNYATQKDLLRIAKILVELDSF